MHIQRSGLAETQNNVNLSLKEAFKTLEKFTLKFEGKHTLGVSTGKEIRTSWSLLRCVKPLFGRIQEPILGVDINTDGSCSSFR